MIINHRNQFEDPTYNTQPQLLLLITTFTSPSSPLPAEYSLQPVSETHSHDNTEFVDRSGNSIFLDAIVISLFNLLQSLLIIISLL
mgnify:CR=1